MQDFLAGVGSDHSTTTNIGLQIGLGQKRGRFTHFNQHYRWPMCCYKKTWADRGWGGGLGPPPFCVLVDLYSSQKESSFCTI